MSDAFQLLGLLCSGLFAGGALYITLVEHPARMECGTDIAVTLFAPSYRRASRAQATLAALGFAGGFQAWWMGSGAKWLVGGVALMAVIPFTLLLVMRTNLELMNPALDKSSREAQRLLTRWGRLHRVRTALGLASFLIFPFAR